MKVVAWIERAATPRRRKWVYRTATGVLGLLGVYGFVTGEQAAQWALFAAAVTGMADANTDAATATGAKRAK